MLALIINSLRYWVQEMHVDGFRFDLPSALARNLYEAGTLGTFFSLIRDDPVLSTVKLIAESWDVGEGGYQVGAFPGQWAEFNDRYRDAVRQFWRGGGAPTLEELARRLTGSADLCGPDVSTPRTSVNFITCHDGFTMHDLVSYNHKHNEANGEGNRDGIDANDSWNCGTEGRTRDRAVQNLRERQKRNFLTTLLLSGGVPMLLAGDEAGRTQQGNNNPYCHDSDLTWVDWQWDERGEALFQFTRRIIAVRAAHPVFRRRREFLGQEIKGTSMRDIGWFTPNGTEITLAGWRQPAPEAIGMYLNGRSVFDRATSSERIADDSFLLLFNRGSQAVFFTLPGTPWAARYHPVIDTGSGQADPSSVQIAAVKAGNAIVLQAHSVLVFRAATLNLD